MSIKVTNLSYIYNQKTSFNHLAIDDISFEIEDDTFVALVGKTGCGKSTLAQLLNGLLLPTSGTIEIEGHKITSNRFKNRKTTKGLRKDVGLVLQFPEYQLFEQTVEKDVAFGPKNLKVKDKEALEYAHAALQLVDIDKSFYQRSPFELSGGEKRKVAIAGILALKPTVLILDEPTAGLDPTSTIEIMNLFKMIQEERHITVILITHDMEIVNKYAKKVILMDDAKIKRICTPEELFKEDADLYSLEMPNVYKLAFELKNKGLKIDTSKINDIDSLVNEIVGAKK